MADVTPEKRDEENKALLKDQGWTPDGPHWKAPNGNIYAFNEAARMIDRSKIPAVAPSPDPGKKEPWQPSK